MSERRRKYTVFDTNCDCASSRTAKLSQSAKRYVYGPRCPICNKVLGWMQYTILGEVMATGDLTALQEFREAKA